MAKKPITQESPGAASGDETNPFKANGPGEEATGVIQAPDSDTE